MPGVSAWALVGNLGDGSALARHERGWSMAQQIAVRTLEEINWLGRLMMALKGVKKRDLPPPLVIPRPGDSITTKKKAKSDTWVGDILSFGDGVEVRRVG
jgi:hypothetical protein